MARKRQFTTYNLSFLDIMSCGFGAVVLVFLIIKHESDITIETENQDLLAEVSLLEEEIKVGEEGLVRARNTTSEIDQRLAEANGLARQIRENIQTLRDRVQELDSADVDQQIEIMEEKLRELEDEKKKLEEEQELAGNNVRRFLGAGDRQYLTGLKLGGARILILLDTSASMLDETLVNIIRRRNMSPAIKRNSPKWQQAVKTVQWLTAQLPVESHYQIYTFSSQYQSILSGTENQWLDIGDTYQLEDAILGLQTITPEGGTSLTNVFSSIEGFEQLPDNIYIITDGLPTLGDSAPKSGTVSGRDRQRLFSAAIEQIPYGIPVNIILLPLEGDPKAAASYWRLAQASRGAFISPSRDWP